MKFNWSTSLITDTRIGDAKPLRKSPRKSIAVIDLTQDEDAEEKLQQSPSHKSHARTNIADHGSQVHGIDEDNLRSLTWDEVCPPSDSIQKIAEASYAEVYRVINERGTSIIKVIRLESPIKAQTKAQVKSGLVDEEPRSAVDVAGELQISELLVDIPGFVVYKERYIVRGKTTKGLLETHRAFQKKMKREDPGRAQFYPSPSRYLDGTKFLVVELGDAGKALEDFELTTESQLWDVFLLQAIALARAEDHAMFEPFGYSGLDITILDYGLSRAEDMSVDFAKPVASDLERDLSLFTSTHAPQCKVYRQMRSFLLKADRTCLPPEEHCVPYAKGVDGPLSWEVYAPYTNVLWLAYLYEYLIKNFKGERAEVLAFRRATREFWIYLNPRAKPAMPMFGSAADIVCYAVEAGWMSEDQILEGTSVVGREDTSIILSREDTAADVAADADLSTRQSPRRRTRTREP
ncbi:Serine/threonine-protein kinase haspin-like protein [Emericellopsis cladophorae]|uniref:non-specific serine/threonine protein kinase n=1 Tax=Emericellopsis cladophorae TaxID=2686198 RepID=A0A9P9Y293_9HYPO|nr:Serine/threonine-protein kinase haspin-like protein [Emericellopsis cladophorae]KAI6782172.1 Serine/threonine-protein kinase haspin-like protein [Emericellopsis cladophorae]